MEELQSQSSTLCPGPSRHTQCWGDLPVIMLVCEVGRVDSQLGVVGLPLITSAKPGVLSAYVCLKPTWKWVVAVVAVAVRLLSRVQLFEAPLDCSTPGFLVHHHLPELAQTHVRSVGDVIQPSGPHNFMAAVTICSDFGGQENKVCHCFHCFPIYLP